MNKEKLTLKNACIECQGDIQVEYQKDSESCKEMALATDTCGKCYSKMEDDYPGAIEVSRDEILNRVDDEPDLPFDAPVALGMFEHVREMAIAGDMDGIERVFKLSGVLTKLSIKRRIKKYFKEKGLGDE